MTFPGDLMYGKKQEVCQTFDKTNIYGVYYSEGVTENRMVVGSTNLTNQIHFANISPEDYPMADLNMLPNLNVQFTPNILWLAFGSSDFFSKNGDTITTKSIISARAQCLEFYGVRWVCRFFEGQPHLPQNVQFLRDTNFDLTIQQEISRPDVPKPENIEQYQTLLRDTSVFKKPVRIEAAGGLWWCVDGSSARRDFGGSPMVPEQEKPLKYSAKCNK